MKHLFGIIITIFFAAHASSQENNQTTGFQGPSIQWVNYLSYKDKVEIARDLAMESIRRQQANGTLYDVDQTQEISVAVSFRPKNSTLTTAQSTDTAIPATASEVSGGNLSCRISVQNPHAGSKSGVIVVKAKSEGDCSYDPVVGTDPPTITWELVQLLSRLEVIYPNPYPIVTVFDEEHVETGLTPSWHRSTTQVFADSCTNATYVHSNSIYIIPPPGWEYTGDQPIQIPNVVAANVTNC